MSEAPTVALRRARGAAALAFATQGMVFISLTTRLPRFSDRWDLSEVELSLILLMIVLLAGVGSVAAELVAQRRDSASTLRAGLVTIGASVPVVADGRPWKYLSEVKFWPIRAEPMTFPALSVTRLPCAW